MAEWVDLGDISLIIQVAILFLLVVGLPLVKGLKSKKNFMIHGYLTTVAVAFHTVLIFVAMIPTLAEGMGEISELSLLNAVNLWLHVVLGTVAEVLGVLLVVSWLRKSPSQMACGRWRRWMLPTFVIWAVSLVGGALVHLLGML